MIHFIVTKLGVEVRRNVLTPICLSDSSLCVHTITVYVPDILAFGTGTHPKLSLVFYDVFCEEKCARKKKSLPDYAELCALIHSNRDRTNAADDSKLNYNLQLTRLVIPSSANDR